MIPAHEHDCSACRYVFTANTRSGKLADVYLSCDASHFTWLIRTGAEGDYYTDDSLAPYFEHAGVAWVGEDVLHTMRRTAGGGGLYTIVEGPRKGERVIEHANGNLTLLPPQILWGAARRSR